MKKRDTIVELARTLHDALATDTIETGAGGTPNNRGSRALQLSDLYHHGSYQPLEHALTQMLQNGKHHPDIRKRVHAGIPLGVLRWHFQERYIRPTRRSYQARSRNNRWEILHGDTWQPVTTPNRHPVGSPMSDTHGHRVQAVEEWAHQVRMPWVELALDWLERNIAPCTCGDKHQPHRLHLPREWDTTTDRRQPVAA